MKGATVKERFSTHSYAICTGETVKNHEGIKVPCFLMRNIFSRDFAFDRLIEARRQYPNAYILQHIQRFRHILPNKRYLQRFLRREQAAQQRQSRRTTRRRHARTSVPA